MNTSNSTYPPQEVESEAQEYWDEHNSFKATEDSGKEKFYCLKVIGDRSIQSTGRVLSLDSIYENSSLALKPYKPDDDG